MKETKYAFAPMKKDTVRIIIKTKNGNQKVYETKLDNGVYIGKGE